jgi:hypothetical protein
LDSSGSVRGSAGAFAGSRFVGKDDGAADDEGALCAA